MSENQRASKERVRNARSLTDLDPNEYILISDAMRILNLGRAVFRAAIESGELPVWRPGTRNVRVQVKHLLRMIDRRTYGRVVPMRRQRA